MRPTERKGPSRRPRTAWSLFAAAGLLAAPGCSALEMLDAGAPRTLFVIDPETAVATTDGDASDPLLIGSWNMRDLGPSEHTPDETRSPQRAAAYVAESNVAILAVQEIGRTPWLAPGRNGFLDDMIEALDRETGGRWTYALGPDDYNHVSICGLLWDRAKVTALSDPPLDLALEGAGGLFAWGLVTWDSQPHAMRFTAGEGRTDFVVVVAHLQSDLGGPLAPLHRAHEAELLVPHLERIQQTLADPDVICLGDFNASTATETCITRMCDSGFVDLNAHDLHTYVMGTPFDRIFVPADQPEFTRSFFVAVRNGCTADEFSEQFSDHYMVVTSIGVGHDDD